MFFGMVSQNYKCCVKKFFVLSKPLGLLHDQDSFIGKDLDYSLSRCDKLLNKLYFQRNEITVRGPQMNPQICASVVVVGAKIHPRMV